MMKIVLIAITLFLFINVNGLEINSKNAILYNMNEESVIYEKNSEEIVQIASLTKIVTAITVIENIDDLTKEITITNEMLKGLNGYVKVGLKVGDKLTYLDLLYALMLPSAGDAAQALAIATSGSIEEFSNLMNEKVKEIGIVNSKFDNPIGKDSENNYSTASDFARILIYSLKNDKFKEIFNTNTYKINNLNKNVKKTLASYKTDTSIIEGAKTGFTYKAGRCLASTTTLEGVDYLFISLGADVNSEYHVIDTINIYDYYSTNYGYINILSKNQLLKTLDVKHSNTKTYDIVSKDNVELYLEKTIQKENLKYEYNGIEELNKKIKKGDKLGKVDIISNDKVIYTYEVYLDANIKYYNYPLYIGVGIILLLLMGFIIKRLKSKK